MPEYPIPDEAVDAAGEALYQHQVERPERGRFFEFFECVCNEHSALGPLTHLGEVIEHQSRAALAAAAPHIAAAALRQAADDYATHVKADTGKALADLGDHATPWQRWDAFQFQAGAVAVCAWLRRRAGDLDGRTHPDSTHPAEATP